MKRAARPALPEFDPVPCKFRHDGWTPERQRAFIGALADTGCVSRAAAMVNMAQANCYTLRRASGAEGFRRAWEAALDFGVQRLKDIAFERAIDGQLVPVFVGGRLMGFRRVRNDKLLMFCLRHYGHDANGRRTKIDYFTTRAQAGTDGSGAQASTTTLRTVTSGGRDSEAKAANDDRLTAEIAGFEGVTLDAQAAASIRQALEDLAERRRGADANYEDGGSIAFDQGVCDSEADFVRVGGGDICYAGELEPVVTSETYVPFIADEDGWRLAGASIPPECDDAIARLAPPPETVQEIASVKRRRTRSQRRAEPAADTQEKQ